MFAGSIKSEFKSLYVSHVSDGAENQMKEEKHERRPKKQDIKKSDSMQTSRAVDGESKKDRKSTSDEGEEEVELKEESEEEAEAPYPGEMYVIKRDGHRQLVAFDKITARVRSLSYGLDRSIDAAAIAQKVCRGVFPGVTTAQLDELAADTAAYMNSRHTDYGRLAGRIAVSNLHKCTSKSFSAVMQMMATHTITVNGKSVAAPLLRPEVNAFVQENAVVLDSAMVYSRDFEFDFFALKTLERQHYLTRFGKKIVERPQHMYMRVACSIWLGNVEEALKTYDYLSRQMFTHATPTLLNAGRMNQQCSSCFLLSNKEDSIEGIFDTQKQTALISKGAGGIGLWVTNVRAEGSYIKGTDGESRGLLPMVRVYNNIARYVDQGGGKRKGAFAIYVDPWHLDCRSLLGIRDNNGPEDIRARDLFLGFMIPDLFMKRVIANEEWSYFCPTEAPDLLTLVGPAFEARYEEYERAGKARYAEPARALWGDLIKEKLKTGTPYIMFRDACNLKSNQQNLGVINCSNLCCEILEYSSAEEVAVCNLASIALPKFVEVNKKGVPSFNFLALVEVSAACTRNLNRVIDMNSYPVEEAKRSNLCHRPIGIGVQGLQDAFVLMRMPFDSEQAALLNEKIFEAIYYGAVRESCALAKKAGKPYDSYAGSPMSQGKLQFDLWNRTPLTERDGSLLWSWPELRAEIKQHGLLNSLLVAPMPTASTASILQNCEACEPFSSNLYVRRVMAGEFMCANRLLVRDLQARGLWNHRMHKQLQLHKGSVQDIDEIPADIKALYKTVWEIDQSVILKMAAARGAYVCQSQSMNLWQRVPDATHFSDLMLEAWELGLKTGSYYLRSESSSSAVPVTVDPNEIKKNAKKQRVKQLARELASLEAATETETATGPPAHNDSLFECHSCSG